MIRFSSCLFVARYFRRQGAGFPLTATRGAGACSPWIRKSPKLGTGTVEPTALLGHPSDLTIIETTETVHLRAAYVEERQAAVKGASQPSGFAPASLQNRDILRPCFKLRWFDFWFLAADGHR